MIIRPVYFSLMALTAVLLLTQSGCFNEPARIVPPSIDADAAGREAIKLYDKDNDGKISGAELDKVPSLLKGLPNFPSTKEKGVTAADITARIKAWQATRTGRMGGVTCKVTRNGKPLAGANVKFVPEKFLGGNMPECSGTTGMDGNARISVPLTGPDDVAGVPPGYYRVEITMSDGSIPAKYNTQTMFGEEIFPDKRGGGGISFDIK
ncbi:MAG: hypothetical protein ABSA77_04005 [Thermoguttaceae bacterium]|jgi:hypothetical protein